MLFGRQARERHRREAKIDDALRGAFSEGVDLIEANLDKVRETVRGLDGTKATWVHGLVLAEPPIPFLPVAIAATDIGLYLVDVGGRVFLRAPYEVLIRFDTRSMRLGLTDLGICIYQGGLPIGEVLRSGRRFTYNDSDLFICRALMHDHLKRAPGRVFCDKVIGKVRAELGTRGVPASAHSVRAFI